jgi:hypothetical protein
MKEIAFVLILVVVLAIVFYAAQAANPLASLATAFK